MSYIDRYRKRLERYGNSAKEAHINQSIKAFERKFTTSPSYYEVEINGEPVDAIVNKISDNKSGKYDTKLINFRHGYTPISGSIVMFEDSSYLLVEVDNDPIYRYGRMTKCNQSITLGVETEEVFIGYDDRNRPIYETISEEKVIPCIVANERYSSNDSDSVQLPLPEGRIAVTMPYVKDLIPEVNSEHMFYERKYAVVDVDFTRVNDDVGVIEVIMERKVVQA